MKLKNQPVKKWKKWLKHQLSAENPDNLTNDEKFVLEAFLELIKKVKNHEKKKT